MDPVVRADLVWAWRALRAQPSVALVSLAAAGLQPLAWRLGAMARHPIAIALTTAIALASLAIAFGWYGAERTFFQSRRQNRAVTLQDLLALVPGFCGRFAALAPLTGLPLRAAYLIGFVFGTDPDGTPGCCRSPTGRSCSRSTHASRS
jgi:hypothetical protein